MAELDSQAKTVQSLYSWYSEGKLWVNRRYQRKLVWTLTEKQKLLESVLKKYPIPAILLAEREGDGYEVIDGLQRLHTLVSFIETAFPTADGRNFDVKQFPTATTRQVEGAFEIAVGDVITPREVSTVLDYSLAVSVMRGATNDEVDDVFGRINTYGHRLSDQERRQAGVRGEFADVVRAVSCEVRGDASRDTLGLSEMPSISIDLPKTRHGYHLSADEIFWVQQGILRATDLRDSMDEQCVADIAASIVGGSLIPRSKEALDDLYNRESAEGRRISTALAHYGADKFAAEFKYLIEEIEKIATWVPPGGLRSLLFSKRNTNPFPALFAVLFLALHELLIGGSKKIASYTAASTGLRDLDKRVDTSRGSTSPDDRRRNIDTIKGLLSSSIVDGEPLDIYGEHSASDVSTVIRRSIVESPHYELKQGLLRLDAARNQDPDIQNKYSQQYALLPTTAATAPEHS